MITTSDVIRAIDSVFPDIDSPTRDRAIVAAVTEIGIPDAMSAPTTDMDKWLDYANNSLYI